jgi:hypothetical protein
MLIAREKRRENVAEYILYMWQIEDMIRAYNFDIDKIDANIVQKYDQPAEVKAKIREWYVDLIITMKEEGITESGHLPMVSDLMDDIYNFHLKLLDSPQETKYREVFNWADASIKEFRKKLNQKNANDLEVCFIALYGLLLMRLKGQKVSDETTHAMQHFSNLLALLAGKYKQWEEEGA